MKDSCPVFQEEVNTSGLIKNYSEGLWLDLN